MRKKTFIFERKDIICEWDYEQNDKLGFDPKTLYCSSYEKPFWICKVCGNKWRTAIRERVKGHSCPECGKKLRARNKSLAAAKQNPLKLSEELVLDWDHEENNKNGIFIKNLSHASNKRVYRKCHKCDYKRNTKLNNRTVLKRGCPLCTNKVLVKGVNDLATKYPNLAKEWDFEGNFPKKPEDIFPSSGKKYYRICPKGHSYQATPNHRVGLKGTGCPICNSGRQTSFSEQAIYFYIKKLYPDAINRFKNIFNSRYELDIYIPSIKLAFEYDGEAHHFKKEGATRKEVEKYKLCKDNGITLWRVIEKEKELLETNSDYNFYSKYTDDYSVLRITIINILNKLKEENGIIVDIEQDKHLIGKYLEDTTNSLASKHPELLEIRDFEKNADISPYHIQSGSEIKVWRKCPICHKSYKSIIYTKTGNNPTECPECGRKKGLVSRHKNYLVKYGCLNDPKLLSEWDYKRNKIKPEEVTKKSDYKAWWICPKCNYNYQAKVHNRANGRDCPVCSNRKIVKGINDFATRRPNLMKDWSKKNLVDPTTLPLTKSEKIIWECHICGHEWSTQLKNRSFKDHGCPSCKKAKKLTAKYRP